MSRWPTAPLRAKKGGKRIPHFAFLQLVDSRGEEGGGVDFFEASGGVRPASPPPLRATAREGVRNIERGLIEAPGRVDEGTVELIGKEIERISGALVLL